MAKSIMVSNFIDKAYHVERVWEILSHSYAQVEGGLLFGSKYELMTKTACWKLIYHKHEIIAVLIYKKKQGKKIVAIGRDVRYGQKSIQLLAHYLEVSLRFAWMEVSEKAEDFILKYCNAHHLVIHHTMAQLLINKTIEPLEDGYHYRRCIAGINKSKLLLGTPAISCSSSTST